MNKNDTLVEDYEQMRRALLDRRQGSAMRGLVILRTKGMATWTKLWREHGQGGVEQRRPQASTADVHRLPRGSDEVVRVLAGMVWAIHKETRYASRSAGKDQVAASSP